MDRQMDIEGETIGNKWLKECAKILLGWNDSHMVYKYICCNTTLTILYACYPDEFIDYEYKYFSGFFEEEWA